MALARPPAADREGTGDIVLSRRPLLGRRATTARLACCSRCVRGKSRANEVDVVPKVWHIRPPRLFARSPTIRSPRPGLILPRQDPLSVTRQFTQEPARISLILISPSRPSKQGVPDRVRHQLVDGQRQAPAPLRLQRQ